MKKELSSFSTQKQIATFVPNLTKNFLPAEADMVSPFHSVIIAAVPVLVVFRVLWLPVGEPVLQLLSSSRPLPLAVLLFVGRSNPEISSGEMRVDDRLHNQTGRPRLVNDTRCPALHGSELE